MSAGDNLSGTAGKDVTIKAGKKMAFVAEDEITLKTGDATICTRNKKSDIAIKGNKISIKGDGEITGKGPKIELNPEIESIEERMMKNIAGENVLEVLLANEDRWDDEPESIEGVVIGRCVDFTLTGEPLVDFASNPSGSPLPAKTTVVLGKETLGGEVLLLFEVSNVRKPIIIGVVQPPKLSDEKAKEVPLGQYLPASGAECDGERIVFSAEKEIVLQCGNARITLTRAGKILICGKYLLSRSSGVNRIKGGSVQIN